MSWKETRGMASLSREGLKNTFTLYGIEDVFQNSIDAMYSCIFGQDSSMLKDTIRLSKDDTDDSIRDNLCEDALKLIIEYETELNKSLLERMYNEEFQRSLWMRYQLISPFHHMDILTTIERPIYRSPLKRPSSTVLD